MDDLNRVDRDVRYVFVHSKHTQAGFVHFVFRFGPLQET